MQFYGYLVFLKVKSVALFFFFLYKYTLSALSVI